MFIIFVEDIRPARKTKILSHFWAISVTRLMRLVVETTLPRGCTSFRSTPQAVPSSFSMLPTQVSAEEENPWKRMPVQVRAMCMSREETPGERLCTHFKEE